MTTTSIKIKTPLCLIAIIFGLLICSNFYAQNMPGESFTITSKYMEGEREIQIALPKGFKAGTAYDVQYMLDPVWNMDLRRSLIDFMHNNTMTSRTILVGVVSPNRASDMTPTKTARQHNGGNAENFIDFIGKEVKPFVESKYKTTGYNTFAGHSYGGLCVMHAMLRSPQYFDAYLVGDPSFWYDDNLMVKLAKEKLPNIEGKALFIGARKRGAYKGMGIDAMEKALEEFAHPSLDWKIVAYEDETHNSVMYKLNYDGIKFISEDYRNKFVTFVPNGGEIVADVPLAVYQNQSNENLRYTLDGSEPSFESEFFKDSVVLSRPATLKVKVPLKRANLRPALSGEFVSGKKLKGSKKNKKHSPGLKYSYYEGVFEKLPNFDTLSVVKTGTVEKNFQIKSFPKKENFACVYEGFFEAKASGYHYFALKSDDGLKFYIHDKLMINNDWRHAAFDQKSTVLYLEKGLHPIKFEYFQFEGKSEISLYFKAPNETPRPMNFELFVHKP